jgi:hypothetical protein
MGGNFLIGFMFGDGGSAGWLLYARFAPIIATYHGDFTTFSIIIVYAA